MIKLSPEQQAIVDAPLKPMAVIACAGSGKTETAVRRLLEIRKLLGNSRSHVALLSFSNVAVNTFKASYIENNTLSGGIDKRVTIDTLDGFITSNILRPHAYRTMKCKQVPFLITGYEPFLQNHNFKFWYTPSSGSDIPIQGSNLKNIIVDIENDEFVFKYVKNGNKYNINNGLIVVKKLGVLGAYTHEFGKYWSLMTLIDQPKIQKILAHRFQHIVVDEAQDIGIIHQYILESLIDEGVNISLIGDPNQAIFEFAGADGEFINYFKNETSNKSFSLTLNYRSIPEILNVANKISARRDEAFNKSINSKHGVYFAIYDPNNHRKTVNTFIDELSKADLSIEKSAVLYRGVAGIDKLRIVSKSTGQGKVKLLAQAAILRDSSSDYYKAFKLVTNCVIGLLENIPKNLAMMIASPRHFSEVRDIRKDIWFFVRSSNKGLPLANLKASSEWHPLVKKRLIKLLESIENKYGYQKMDRIGNKLAKTRLLDLPLIPDSGQELQNRMNIRVDTVHQAKGESLDAVLYMANKNHIEAMLSNDNTELSRIGYVAVTRAKNLFVLGVPKNASQQLIPKLQNIGFKTLET